MPVHFATANGVGFVSGGYSTASTTIINSGALQAPVGDGIYGAGEG